MPMRRMNIGEWCLFYCFVGRKGCKNVWVTNGDRDCISELVHHNCHWLYIIGLYHNATNDELTMIIYWSRWWFGDRFFNCVEEWPSFDWGLLNFLVYAQQQQQWAWRLQQEHPSDLQEGPQHPQGRQGAPGYYVKRLRLELANLVCGRDTLDRQLISVVPCSKIRHSSSTAQLFRCIQSTHWWES